MTANKHTNMKERNWLDSKIKFMLTSIGFSEQNHANVTREIIIKV